MMTKGSLCLYIAAVLILTVIQIHGQKVKCKNKEFTLVNGTCYRFNPYKLSWTAAKENCEKWNGQLAPYTSPEQIRTGCKIIGSNVWVQGPEFPEKGFQWSFACASDYFTLFSEDCKTELPSFCIEKNDATETNTIVISRSIAKRDSINEIPKVTCLRNDSVLVDTQCYRSPTEETQWTYAAFYCEDHKEKLATISSIGQAIQVIKSLDLIGKKLWVQNQFEKKVLGFVSLIESGSCQQYEFGHLPETLSLRFLCMTLPIPYIETTTMPASTTTQESQGKKKPTNKNGLQLVKKVGQKTRIDYDTNIYFYEK